jgi:predicted enzyme related to lactoylglutathione lyase
MVKSCDASGEKSKSLGGKVLFGPKDIEKVGRFAVIQDPQGASFSIFQPA